MIRPIRLSLARSMKEQVTNLVVEKCVKEMAF